MLTTEIAATAVARHEGHLDSISDFALITLTGTAGFGHREVSSTGRIVLVIPVPWCAMNYRKESRFATRFVLH